MASVDLISQEINPRVTPQSERTHLCKFAVIQDIFPVMEPQNLHVTQEAKLLGAHIISQRFNVGYPAR